jgi:hypothetical protein
MKYYSYVVARDFGFAPNPFGQHCTLATCKHKIRKKASKNDWIFGITSKTKGNKLVYAMKVNRVLTFDEYWNATEFQYKKPVLNGSLKQMYGDNIYHFDKSKEEWCQADSHHSLENGEVNLDNLNRDTSGEFVLVSEEFYYFGSENIEIPSNLKARFSVGRGHKHVKEEAAKELIGWLRDNYEIGFIGDPMSFEGFQRYDGVS